MPGFDTDLFVEQPVNANLICTICHEVQNKPIAVCDQGHTFCTSCVRSMLFNCDKCPECRQVMNEKKYINRPLQSIIMSLRVKCPRVDEEQLQLLVEDADGEGQQGVSEGQQQQDDLEDDQEEHQQQEELYHGQEQSRHKRPRLDEQSTTDLLAVPTATVNKTINTTTNSNQRCQCQWEGPLSDFLEVHNTKECPFLKQQCPRCQTLVQLANLEKHLHLVCPYRMVTCPQCHRPDVGAHELQVHLHQNCPHKPIQCPHCLQHMLLQDFGSEHHHHDYTSDYNNTKVYSGHMKVCPLLEIDCSFAIHGCPARMPRKDLQEHEQACWQQHITLLNDSLQHVQHDKDWHQATISWEIPTHRILSSLTTVGNRLESQRVHVDGDFTVFAKLTVVRPLVDQNNHNNNNQNNNQNNNNHSSPPPPMIHAQICVEHPKSSGLLMDRINIQLANVPSHHAFALQSPPMMFHPPQRLSVASNQRRRRGSEEYVYENDPNVYEVSCPLHLCHAADKRSQQQQQRHRSSRDCSLVALQKILDYSKLNTLVFDFEFRLRYDNVYQVGCL